MFGAEEANSLMGEGPAIYPPSVRSSILKTLWVLLLVVVIALAVVSTFVWQAASS